ncbi:MAG: tetratricopeptide repeat protein [Pyrinomonadaceae bacterium]
MRGITDLNGELIVAVATGKRNVSVSKDGYETMQSSVNVTCAAPPPVSFKLKPKQFEIRVKANLPNCDIFINDPPEFIGRTDENGRFSFAGRSLTVFVQARKAGYLSDSKSVSSASPPKEVLLNLTPIPAQIRLNSDVANATAHSEGDEKIYPVAEPFLLEPGRRKLVVTALGYKPIVLDLDLQPSQKLEKTISLERLPVSDLLIQADQFLKKQSYQEAMQLCRYVLESEPGNPTANRLIGMIYLERKSYVEAEPYFMQALNGGETIVLEIRRHAGEKFELTSGHGLVCEGQLLFYNNHLEYRGSAGAENFNASYSEIQIVGLQLKKNVASFLGLKFMNAKGSKKDYNFFSKENELSQEGRGYLEMIQRLIRRNRA